jgi:NAD(P)-dependent dehydrogenase (short-subunit alcohol dehydrogenase family)
MERLEGKVAVISGAARGIGAACAVRSAAEGAKVVVADIKDGSATVDRIREAGGEAVYVEMDVRQRADWERTRDTAIEEFGHIDLLGNVAGVVNLVSADTIVDLTDDGWNFVIDTDLKGVWLGMQALIPHFISQKFGRIVNISSAAALKAIENLASYSAAKAGVIGLTQQGAIEYAPFNININAICPGTIDTPIQATLTPEELERNRNSHLIKRFGQPEEIAGMMAYLFSEDGAFTTGMSYSVDGGWTINGRNY